MSAPKQPLELPQRFRVHDTSDGTVCQLFDHGVEPRKWVANFSHTYRERAVRLAEELNIHELAEQVRAADAPDCHRLELPPLRASSAAFPNTASGVLEPPRRPSALLKLNGKRRPPRRPVDHYSREFLGSLGAIPADRVFNASETNDSVFETEWRHCSPRLLEAGYHCASGPRRACECPDNSAGHDHLVDGSWLNLSQEIDS